MATFVILRHPVTILVTGSTNSDNLTYTLLELSIFSRKEIHVIDYFSYVKYKDLCATINTSTSKMLKIENYSKTMVRYSNNYQNIGVVHDLTNELNTGVI